MIIPMRIRTSALITVAALAVPACTIAQPSTTNWPSFRGPSASGVAEGYKLPVKWNVETKQGVKWVVGLGSQAYGNPVIAGGRIFVGTNNEGKRNPKIVGDKGVVMCFRESDGKFLWQAVHDKLTAGRVNDWPEQGVCSSGVV